MNPIDVVDVPRSADAVEAAGPRQNGERKPVGSRVVSLTRRVRVSAFEVAESGTGKLLGVGVKNLGAVPLEVDRVAFEYRFEDPDEYASSWGRVLSEIGGTVELLARQETKRGPLQPGEEREYSLPRPMSEWAVLVAEGLTPPRFWVAAYVGGVEAGRAGGECVRRVLGPSGITVHRRASHFYTAPESVRLSVLEAIAPLRGVEPEMWPSAGAKPLEGTPRTFVVRAALDPIVLVTPNDDEGVEIVDLIRKGSLEEFRRQANAEAAKS